MHFALKKYYFLKKIICLRTRSDTFFLFQDFVDGNLDQQTDAIKKIATSMKNKKYLTGRLCHKTNARRKHDGCCRSIHQSIYMVSKQVMITGNKLEFIFIRY